MLLNTKAEDAEMIAMMEKALATEKEMDQRRALEVRAPAHAQPADSNYRHLRSSPVRRGEH